MLPLQSLLNKYGESHQHPVNKNVHWVCVPVIFFTLVGMLWILPFPFFATFGFQLNWAIVVLVPAIGYYVLLSPSLAVGMTLFSGLCLILCYFFETYLSLHLGIVCLSAFVVAWIGQFWGHKIEGKKPSFLEDIQFLLIGPVWLLSFIYDKLKIRY